MLIAGFDAEATNGHRLGPGLDATGEQLSRARDMRLGHKAERSSGEREKRRELLTCSRGQLLLHGTAAVEAIVNSVDGHGFLPLLAGTSTGAIWGDGTYFARDAKYSNEYARRLASGKKQMLLVDVLVGRSAQGAKGMKKCPLLPGESFVRCNSLVDSIANPLIFVVQHSNQAYPSYLITYTRY